MPRSVAVFGILALLGTGFVMGTKAAPRLQGTVLGADCTEQFSLLSPWVRCEDSADLKKHGEFTDFRQALDEYIASERTAGKAHEVAVYFRDLQNGPWFGINEREDFAPASLLKLPILMEILKHAEGDPGLLQRNVLADPSAGGLSMLNNDADAALTVEQALENMIIESDNTAKDLLTAYMEKADPHEDFGNHVLSELNLLSDEPSTEDFMRIKSYAALFRTLYNSSYLDKAMSQKALDLLARTTYAEGLVAGVPKSVTVAHKYGIRMDRNQLHDCGIVYHSSDPYLICIMTRSASIEDSARIIREISRRTYEEVDRRSRL